MRVRASECVRVCHLENSKPLHAKTVLLPRCARFPRPTERERCSHDNVSRVEWTRFSTTDSSTTRTKGGFASLDVRDRVHFSVPLQKRKEL